MVATIDLPAFEALAALAALPGVTAIDFTAAWCAPCKTMKPILAALATEYLGRARVVAVDVNDEPILAERYSVRSMPTLVILRDGREVGRVVGSRPKKFVAGVLERALAGDVAIASPWNEPRTHDDENAALAMDAARRQIAESVQAYLDGDRDVARRKGCRRGT